MPRRQKQWLSAEMRTNQQVNIKVDGTAVKQVGSFNYLGETISDDGRYVDEIKKRIGIAITAFSKMKDVWKSIKITLNTRKRILQCYMFC